MPITLGCPSCGKRFRARDESAGKRVKCPYCAAAVPVPTAEEAAAAGAPTAAIPPAAPATAARPAAGSGADAWSGSGAAASTADRNPFAHEGTAQSSPAAAPRRAATPAKPVTKPAKPVVVRTPEEHAAAGWKKARAGLSWVLFGLFWLTIPGFVGFGKLIYTRSAGALPQGEGGVRIPGYVNDNDVQNSVRMTKTDQLDVALYAAPVLLGGLCLTFGRLTAGAAPRSSGASGLFAGSGLFTLLALAGLLTAAVCHKDRLNIPEGYGYAAIGFLIFGALAEFWFLNGLTASGLALNHPRVARSVGLIGFLFALAAFVPTVGWTLYTEPQWKLRPAPLTEEWKLYEQAALMIGWLLVIGMYWRAVRGVRMAIRETLDATAA